MKRISLIVLSALVLSLFSKVHAQVVTLDEQYSTDDIPERIQNTILTVSTPDTAWIVGHASYGYTFGEQEPFKGTPRLRDALHSIQIGAYELLFERRLRMSVSVGCDIVPNGSTYGSATSSMRLIQPIDSVAGTLLSMRASIEASFQRERTLASALHEHIGYEESSGELSFDLAHLIDLTGHVLYREYSDDNAVISGYGYLLWQALSRPEISLGYSYSHSNSRRDNWRLTGSQFDSTAHVYNYQYAYYPYFNPRSEQGHSAIAIVQLKPVENVYMYAKVTCPFSSSGQLKYMPATGQTPVPIDAGGYYEQSDILPLQVDVAIATDAVQHMVISADVGYFRKPYYTSLAWHLQLKYSF